MSQSGTMMRKPPNRLQLTFLVWPERDPEALSQQQRRKPKSSQETTSSEQWRMKDSCGIPEDSRLSFEQSPTHPDVTPTPKGKNSQGKLVPCNRETRTNAFFVCECFSSQSLGIRTSAACPKLTCGYNVSSPHPQWTWSSDRATRHPADDAKASVSSSL